MNRFPELTPQEELEPKPSNSAIVVVVILASASTFLALMLLWPLMFL